MFRPVWSAEHAGRSRVFRPASALAVYKLGLQADRRSDGLKPAKQKW